MVVDLVAQADRADAGKKRQQVAHRDEDQQAGEIPKAALGCRAAHQHLQEIHHRLDNPLDEVLDAGRHQLGRAHGELNDPDNDQGDDDLGNERVGDLEPEDVEQVNRVLRQAFLGSGRRGACIGKIGESLGEKQRHGTS